MLSKLLHLLFGIAFTFTHVIAQGSDYIDVVPATVYEAEEMSPQNMDFDATNNMFVAHSGWYNDKLIHYYKFRIFAPPTYPDVITPTGTSAEVPLQRIFFVTTTGDFDGVLGMPIIEYHTIDGVLYSDFMYVVFVTAPEGYVGDTFQSVGDLDAANVTMTETDIVLNIPVVPTGSMLQDPASGGTNVAPISPIMVFYRGQKVQTFLFEVTDPSAAAYFASSRGSDSSVTTSSVGRQGMNGYEIPIVPTFATKTFVSAIPLWHVNQFSRGVLEGMGGGPNPAGMRNVINLDRADSGYSPLWNIFWATEMPINYSADEFSNAAQATADNGFKFAVTPMYINCPDIGIIGEMNSLKMDAFESMIVLQDGNDSFFLLGSAPDIILVADAPIQFVAKPSKTVIGETMTNMLGGYEYELMADDIPDGTTEVVVMHNGTSIRTIEVVVGSDNDMADAADSAATLTSMVALVATFLSMIM